MAAKVKEEILILSLRLIRQVIYLKKRHGKMRHTKIDAAGLQIVS